MTQASNLGKGGSNFNSTGQLSLTTGVTGILPAANGGTGSSTGYFASGTALLFYQASAPTGWTKSTANDNKALRVVSGATGGSSGGSVAFTTAFASQAVSGTVGTSGSTTATNQNTTATGTVGTTGSTSVSGTVGSTTLSESQMPSHRHQGIAYCGAAGCGPLQYRSSTTNILDTLNQYLDNTNYVGGSGSHNHSFSGDAHTHTGGTFTGTAHTHTQDAHTHTGGTFTGTAINLAVQYVDVIIATKD